MSIKNGVLGDGSFALLTALIMAFACADVAIAADGPSVLRIGGSLSTPVTADGFLDKPFEQNFLDRFGSFSDGRFSHAPVGMTVPGPTAMLTAGMGLLMISGRRRTS